MPLFTVITPVFNGAATLAACLDSVAGQGDGGLVEHLVQDGGSTDGSAALAAGRPGVRWVSAPDRGIYDAMNQAVARAAGDRVLFLGADDCLLPGVLARIAALPWDGTSIQYGDAWLLHAHRAYDGPFTARKLLLCNLCHQAVLYPRELLAARPFDLRYRLLADHALHLDLWGAGVPFSYIPVLISLFNDQGASAIRMDEAFWADFPGRVRRAFGPGAWRWYRYRMFRHSMKVRVLRLLGLSRA